MKLLLHPGALTARASPVRAEMPVTTRAPLTCVCFAGCPETPPLNDDVSIITAYKKSLGYRTVVCVCGAQSIYLLYSARMRKNSC